MPTLLALAPRPAAENCESAAHPRRVAAALTLRFGLLHGLIAALSPLVSYLLAKAAVPFFGKSIDPASMMYDVTLYFKYASAAMAGKIPYRDIPIEYPPFSFPIFLLPRLFTSNLFGYCLLFGVELLLIQSVAVFLMAQMVARRDGARAAKRALLWYTGFFAALSPIIVARYDLAPMALAFCAAVAWFETPRRARLGGLLAAAGGLVKLYPALLAAPAFLQEFANRRVSRMRGTSVFVMVCAAGLAGWWMMPLGLRYFLDYHGGRGLEIEAVPAGLLMAATKLTGGELHWTLDHVSVQLVTRFSAPAAAICVPLQGILIGFVMWRFARSAKADAMRYSCAIMLAFVLGGKVLSPQYLVWLMPFIAILPENPRGAARRLFLLCAVLTTILFPFAFRNLMDFGWFPIVSLNVRNGLLCYLLLDLLAQRKIRKV